MKLLIVVALSVVCMLLAAGGGGALASDQVTGRSVPEAGLGVIAFVRSGDLWIQEPPDGVARRLTTEGDTRAPRVSPSGAWIAYLRETEQPGQSDLWVIRASGLDARRVATLSPGPGDQVAWSPTDERLAFVADGGLFVARPDAPEPQELVATGAGVQNLAWSPDGLALAFARTELRQPGAPPERTATLERVALDGSAPVPIVDAGQPAEGGFLVAGWTPDGTRLLYWTQPLFSSSLLADGVPLMAVPVAGGTPVAITPTMLAHQGFLDWSADGAQLALIAGGGRATWADKVLTIIAAPGDPARLSSEDQAAVWPSWSSDDAWIAYSAGPAASGAADASTADEALMQRRIWLARPDGTDRHALTTDPASRDERPRWSADDAWILFARQVGQGEQRAAQLWLARADGTASQVVVDDVSLRPGADWPEAYGYVDWGDLWDWRPIPASAATN